MKYLFTAYFKDKTFYNQNEEDISVLDANRSCFYDVQQEIAKGNDLLIFCLSDGTHSYLVDLQDGHFEINEAHLFLGEVEPVFNRRLIYFRRNTLAFIGSDKTDHTMTFFLGWQGNETPDPNSKNIQKTIQIL